MAACPIAETPSTAAAVVRAGAGGRPPSLRPSSGGSAASQSSSPTRQVLASRSSVARGNGCGLRLQRRGVRDQPHRRDLLRYALQQRPDGGRKISGSNARLPTEERRTEFVFKSANAVAHRRLRDAAPSGRPAKVLFLANCQKVMDLVHFHRCLPPRHGTRFQGVQTEKSFAAPRLFRRSAGGAAGRAALSENFVFACDDARAECAHLGLARTKGLDQRALSFASALR